MNKVLVILGPTATGKTDLSLHLAEKFNGELVSADSRQVYTGLDIGTGKMPAKFQIEKANGYWVISGIRIWMYDVVNPKGQYNVARFTKDATIIISNIHKRGKLPILVGGTGLYIKALLEGFSNLVIPVDKKLRKNLEKQTLSQLQEQLKKVSPKRWRKMNYSDRQNPRRLIRAIELSGIQRIKFKRPNYKTFKIGLTAPREILYLRIDERILSRINQGMIGEANNLHKKGLSLKRMKQLGLEYRVLADFLSGKIKEKDGLVNILKGKIHNFAKRQITWFKKEKDVNWFDITEKNYLAEVENLVAKWYHTNSYAKKD